LTRGLLEQGRSASRTVARFEQRFARKGVRIVDRARRMGQPQRQTVKGSEHKNYGGKRVEKSEGKMSILGPRNSPHKSGCMWIGF